MPNYDYQCEKCGQVIEYYQSITAKILKTHKQVEVTSKCDGRVIRLIGSGSGFKITGDGVYKKGWSF